MTGNRATVHDDHLGAAFARGVAEGVEHRGDEEELVVGYLFEGTKLDQDVYPWSTPDFIRALGKVQNHLDSATGASVTIERRWKSAQALSEPQAATEQPSDDEIVDAEIVD